jgi:hypothetical protein
MDRNDIGPETLEDTMARFLWACLVMGVLVVIPTVLVYKISALLRTPTMDCNRFWGLCWKLLDPGWYN